MPDVINFKDETLEYMKSINKTPDDIAYITGNNKTMSWEIFAKAADFDYNCSYGTNYVNLDLYIVFKDNTWMARSEYDGSEGWTYRTLPSCDDMKHVETVEEAIMGIWEEFVISRLEGIKNVKEDSYGYIKSVTLTYSKKNKLKMLDKQLKALRERNKK